jgi:hypothetical protein
MITVRHPLRGKLAGFWGNEAIDQKLHDIGTSGPVVLEPRFGVEIRSGA